MSSSGTTHDGTPCVVYHHTKCVYVYQSVVYRTLLMSLSGAHTMYVWYVVWHARVEESGLEILLEIVGSSRHVM